MNGKKASELSLDRVTFDRLVDGALSADEYRRVLRALESKPEAWRLCAEAFLEAQAWRGEFGSLRQSATPAAAEAKPMPAIVVKPRGANANWLSMSLVALAGFFLAFSVVRTVWQQVESVPRQNSGSPPLVAEMPVNNGASPNGIGNQPNVPTTLVSHQPFGKVQFPVSGDLDEEPAVVEVPVYDEAAASELLTQSRPALPEDLVHALEAEGHQVNLERRFLTVQLDDGREMMLPVEGYRIVPVSRPSY